MVSVLRAVGRALAALFARPTYEAPRMRRPVSELLNIGYKFAHGPHSTKDTDESTKEAA